jgi:hypothetical protein
VKRCHVAKRSPSCLRWSEARSKCRFSAKCCRIGPKVDRKDLVQIGGVAEMFLIDKDALSIEQDHIPNGGRSDVLGRESAEVELPLANAMHQLDAGNRGCGTPEPFKSEHHVRSGLDVRWSCSTRLLRYFEDRTFVSSGSRLSAFISRTARCEAA